MNLFKFFLPLALAILFIRAYIVKDTYILSKDFVVIIHGTSNIHNWDEKVGIVSGDCIAYQDRDGSYNIDAITIKMDVHSIKSDMGSIMNNNTYRALKADVNPEIIFALNFPVKFNQTKSDKNSVSAKGNLTIAGIKRSVDMSIQVVVLKGEKLSFEGSQTINMIDYGIKPPTAILGTLKTGSEIKIDFKVNFIPKTINK